MAVAAVVAEKFEQLLSSCTQLAAMGVESWPSRLCGRILTPSPNATDDVRVTRREVWATGFDCGAGVSLHRRHATPGGTASIRLNPATDRLSERTERDTHPCQSRIFRNWTRSRL
jgi:hypothetical protein